MISTAAISIDPYQVNWHPWTSAESFGKFLACLIGGLDCLRGLQNCADTNVVIEVILPHPRANERVGIPPRRTGGSFVSALINGRNNFGITIAMH